MGINYLISGHSYNENDTAHSVIESAFRKNTLYTMAQWETAIQTAFRKSPAEVNVLTHRIEILSTSKILMPFQSILMSCLTKFMKTTILR